MASHLVFAHAAAIISLFSNPACAAPSGASAQSSEASRQLSIFNHLGNLRVPLGWPNIDAKPAAASVKTAVYDIEARVVILPDGTRLEAHSGLGDRADNPRFVRERMRGSTPPALYDLVALKRAFHGVAALRLVPIDSRVFGRTDLLAHTYMLHGRPESFGCVVFRDYAPFLQAFRQGQITRILVRSSVGGDAPRLYP